MAVHVRDGVDAGLGLFLRRAHWTWNALSAAHFRQPSAHELRRQAAPAVGDVVSFNGIESRRMASRPNALGRVYTLRLFVGSEILPPNFYKTCGIVSVLPVTM